MSDGLIIVESPAKARTLKRFLGSRFDVRASMGHVRDLPDREMAVDVERGFEPRYVVVESRKPTLAQLKKAIPRGGQVILASDPDREGEAIAWHLSEVLGLKQAQRIEFHEITSQAVEKALLNPRQIDMRRVQAQQARRIVDRLVGYRISPFLWSKVQKGIGAGRVQSVALRLVCDREDQIRVFTPQESWSIDALLSRRGAGEQDRFKARLHHRQGLDKLELKSKEQADQAAQELTGADYTVLGVERKRRSKTAPPPYMTSTLQQDASSRLRFSPRRTMRLAQDLYEGIELGSQGSSGLITYMRTDSTRISEEADQAVKAWIKAELGERYLGKPRAEKSRPGAQEAHEAIRPTDPRRRPEEVRQYLTPDQFRLYDLIWRRFTASRMAPALYAGTQAEIGAGALVFRASGSVLAFDGFFRIWERDEKEEEALPELVVGEVLSFHGLELEQHFSQPPARYTEATLIRELEERGIGRPSTYASIVSVIQDHGYVEQQERRLHPTVLGESVNSIMKGHFQEIVDDRYTAAIEGRLDGVEQGREEWVPVVGDFYEPLERMLSAAEEAIPQETGESCPECGEGQLILRASRYGPFKGCSRYPKCKYRQPLSTDGAAKEPQLLEDKCPQCGRQLQVRSGRFGEFVGCSGYPECRYIRREEKEARPTGQPCPECGRELVERQGRYGPFISCSGYPECRYRARIAKDGAIRPQAQQVVLEEKCPECGRPMVERQGRYGKFKSCSGYPQCKGPQGARGAGSTGKRATKSRTKKARSTKTAEAAGLVASGSGGRRPRRGKDQGS